MPDPKPVISICVANYNGEALICDCLESIKAQDADCVLEIIVHDDASTDRSVELIRKYHPDVKLIASDRNVGFCVANNRMASAARGRYLLLLNNDATLLSDALTVLLQHALRGPRGNILTLPQYDMETRNLVDVGRKIDLSLNPVPRTDLETSDVAMCIGACLWIPRLVWAELGGFPEWFDSIGEDLFLCLAAWRAGYRVTAIGQSGYLHHIGYSFRGGRLDADARLSSSMRRRRLSEVNRTRSLAILAPLPLRWLLLCLHLLSLTIEGAVMSIFHLRPSLWTELYLPAILSPAKDRYEIRDERRRLRRVIKTPFWRLASQVTWFPYKLRMLIRHGIPRVSA